MKSNHREKRSPKKEKKNSIALILLSCAIALVMLLTIVVGYSLSIPVNQNHPRTLGKWAATTPDPDRAAPIEIVGDSIKDTTSEIQTTSPPPSTPIVNISPPQVMSMKPYPHNSSDWVDTSLEATLVILQAHPLFEIMSKNPNSKIENVLIEMQQFDKCIGKPLIITMAKIGTPLYWQLVQNFVYSMAKFDIVECSLMVCISDEHCMELCQHSSFPCYQYDDHSGDISAFQKIANLKLHAVPLAAAKGVNIFMVDLDVGFRQSPLLLVQDFMRDPSQDILVQKDVSFVMNRTVAGWRTWFTKPVVNIGLFVFKGNPRVEYMFKRAWRIYQNHGHRLDQPGTDQSIIQDCLHKSHDHKKIKLAWGFFPDSQVVLVDKIFKFETQNIELGGELADSILTSTLYKRDAIAVHATCYEMKVKVHALKAVGAFWNPDYYAPHRRTLTMKIYFRNSRQLRAHINALAWLALATNRSLLIPNLLADSSLPEYRHANLTAEGHTLWPGWRVMKLMDDQFPLSVVEPGYYWRIKRHYVKDDNDIPDPFILSTFETSASRILKLLRQHDSEPRMVLNVLSRAHFYPPPSSALSSSTSEQQQQQQQAKAAIASIENTLWHSVSDSVGIFTNYSHESAYSPALVPANTPVPGQLLFKGQPIAVEASVRACSRILYPQRGNRSCFDKCK